MTASEKFAKGRAALILGQPFFGSLALKLTPVEMPDGIPSPMGLVKTAATDGDKFYYHPEFVNGITSSQLVGLICHEVLHCALQHHTRRNARDPVLWNQACDYAINPLIVDSGMQLPEGGLYDREYLGMSAEEVYKRLQEQADPQNGGSDGGDSDGQQDADGPESWGTVLDAKGADGESASEAEMREAAQEWRVAIAQAAQQARSMGEMPGAIDRMVRETLDPKLDWRDILHRFVDMSSRNDYSWMRPSRRYVSHGVYLPSLKSDELENIVIAVDTSGSIDQRELDEFSAELQGLIDQYQPHCTVIYCDTEVQRVDEIPPGEPVELKSPGGGGTDFRPPFEYLEDRGIEPACMIYFTDGDCYRFPDEPSFPVLWALFRGERNVPFGETVVV